MATKSLGSMLSQKSPTRVSCLTVRDHGWLRCSAIEFFRLSDKRDLQQAARLCEQMARQNRAALSEMDCALTSNFSGNEMFLNIQAGSMVGAIPLQSPTSAAHDYGLVVQPRFEWAGIGSMLSEMGWNVVPRPLKMPMMRTSERRVPPWVLSSMVLHRMRRLLDILTRRFEMITEVRTAPKGSVLWSNYAVNYMSKGDLLSLPCSFPDLRDDLSLKSAIRCVVEKHRNALGTQRSQGKFVHELLDLCAGLLFRVRDVSPVIPKNSSMQRWLRSSLRSEPLCEGIEAIEWTMEDRGLAGLSELDGLPWAMPMEEFYESWVETVFRIVARDISCVLKTGRKRETTRAIAWEPAYLGSQKSLIPDLWMEGEDFTVIIDAKYKRHWEELRSHSWKDFEEEMRERHRNDLMQALAYANLSTTKQTITCLAYPCSNESWRDMLERKKLIHRASIPTGERNLELWLIAVPMAVPVREIADVFAKSLREAMRLASAG